MVPETTDYMIYGYVVIFGVMLIYLISLLARWTKLKKDMQVLQEWEDKQP